jgi:N6-adenosine-specific RNA methylase IME4
MGFAVIQTFHVGNFSNDPESLDNWHFKSKPDLTWILTTAVGLSVFCYGFVGFWLCERKRKLWRINLHCMKLRLLMG